MRLPRITDENRRWWILGNMTLALAMIMIDATVVSVALPTIQEEFDSSQSEVQWVMNAYLLSLAVLVALGGRLGDMFGHGRIFKIGVAIFILSSAAAGAAQSDTWLIAARAIEGGGAALMIPATMAIVTNSFPADMRGLAMGIFAGISMVALALGPLLGGVLTQEVDWRAIFYINIPIGIIAVAVTYLTLREEVRREDAKFDWLGLAPLIFGLTAVVLALMQSSTWGWGSPATIILLVGGLLTLVAFVLIELRVEEPLVEMRLFKNRNFSVDVSVLGAVQFTLMGLTVFGAIWIQNVLGFDPIEAGLSLLPITIPVLFAAPIAGRYYDRIGPRFLVGMGTALAAIGFAWCALFLDKESFPWLIPGYILLGIGIGQVMTPTNTDGMNSAQPELRGQAGGVIQTMRQVGGTVGLAIMGAVVAGVQKSSLNESLSSQSGISSEQLSKVDGLLSQAEAGQQEALSKLPAGVLEDAAEALTSAVSTTYWLAAGLLVVTCVVAVTLLRQQRAVDADDARETHPRHPAV
ncbi:MAG: DHA2 family efflux MFS transporter permease subunit [Solirubrobacterales bacterium]